MLTETFSIFLHFLTCLQLGGATWPVLVSGLPTDGTHVTFRPKHTRVGVASTHALFPEPGWSLLSHKAEVAWHTASPDEAAALARRSAS